MSVLLLTRSAVVPVDDAVPALVAVGADAVVRSVGVATGGAVAARRRHDTFVHIFVTQAARVAQRARARKVEEVARRRASCTVAASVGRNKRCYFTLYLTCLLLWLYFNSHTFQSIRKQNGW